MDLSEHMLPKEILARATVRGNEYAWALTDIPTVIDAARAANLLNIGGQLQFRIPDGGACECYWVEVDTYKEVSNDLPWAERVFATAESAISQFNRLSIEYDFVAEGRSAFGEHLQGFEAKGGNVNDALCFIWYVSNQNEAEAEQGDPDDQPSWWKRLGRRLRLN